MGKWTKLAALAQLAIMITAAPVPKPDAEALKAPADSQSEKLWTRKPNAEGLWAPSSSEELWVRVPKAEGKAEALWTRDGNAELLWTRVPKSEADAEALWTREGKAEELWTRAPEGESRA